MDRPDGVPATGLAITVLGSGGPFLRPDRVSSGYLVWLDGRPRLLVDAGGGVSQRLGVLGLGISEVDAVLLTHLHIDHSGGLPSLVFAAWMEGRCRPLTVVGPAPDRGEAGCAEFCEHLFGVLGAWRYLNSFDGFGTDAHEAPSVVSGSGNHAVSTVLDLGDLWVQSVPVPHGMMPSVAYRVRSADASVCFSGDLEDDSPGLTLLALDADLLVHDLALPERDLPHSHLHAKPSPVGRQADRSHVRGLLLTHVMPELEDEREEAERVVREHYDGDVTWAADLTSYAVPARP